MHHLVAVQGDQFSFTAIQGEALGRPGRIEVLVEVKSGKPVLVKIAGQAVIAFQTTLIL